MARARIKEDWLHTSRIIETLANVHRDPKKRRKPYTWKDFHPLWLAKKKESQNRVSIADVMTAWGFKKKQE